MLRYHELKQCVFSPTGGSIHCTAGKTAGSMMHCHIHREFEYYILGSQHLKKMCFNGGKIGKSC